MNGCHLNRPHPPHGINSGQWCKGVAGPPEVTTSEEYVEVEEVGQSDIVHVYYDNRLYPNQRVVRAGLGTITFSELGDVPREKTKLFLVKKYRPMYDISDVVSVTHIRGVKLFSPAVGIIMEILGNEEYVVVVPPNNSQLRMLRSRFKTIAYSTENGTRITHG